VSKPLFTFAIVTDTHIRPPGGDESSPFAVNDLANDRARYAIHAIAWHKPEFTIHLGDMVHPLPHLPTYAPAAEEALSIFAPLRDTMHFVAGNHDVGDKPMAGAPAGSADEKNIRIFRSFFGEDHYSFDHDDIHVAVINSSVVDSGSEIEASQRAWLKQDLNNNDGKRIILFTHYPPFIDTTDEPPHYDNYDRPGRAWLLALFEKHNVEAVFSGHVHQFFYNRHGGTRLYCLPPTSFTRQDYSELYRVEPALEYGRNDTGKFSYALVDILPEGHRVRVIPTEGRGLKPGAELSAADPVAARPAPAPVTVHLRHAWARASDLPYNGPMEEFGRKRARDDYLLLRLWQMRIARVRTPLADLFDPEYARRVHDFASAGIRFTFFCPGVPDDAAWKLCVEHAAFIDAVEFVANTTDLSDMSEALSSLKPKGGPRIRVGKFHSSAHEPKQGSKFAHSVSFGFKWEERDTVLDALRDADTEGCVGGLAFQINLEDDLNSRLGEMDRWAGEAGLDVAGVVRLANIDPAVANFDDEAIAERVDEMLSAPARLRRTTLQLDTYADIDRGYHPRNGLIDRRSNFRAAGLLLVGNAETESGVTVPE
jgi:3',5'-cyclic AMP phosphodiesterase CpdA